MAIYGTPLTMGGGGGGQNETLPPLLDNFKAKRADTNIVLSADKMPVSRANALAGAVWVYGEHEPKNVNDGTKLEIARDEITRPDADPYVTLADIPASDAKTETIVNLKESDGKLHPYLYLHNNYENSKACLLLRKEIYKRDVWDSAYNSYNGSKLDKWCEDTFVNTILDSTVSRALVSVSFPLYNMRLQRKCFAISGTEYGWSNTRPIEGTALPYFKDNTSRQSMYQSATSDYWTRTKGNNGVWFIGLQGNSGENIEWSVAVGYRPAICLKTSFQLKATPNEDGSYDMYEESAPKTRASGKTVGDLASKSKVKLGRYAGTELQWLVCRNAEKKLFLILAAESMDVLGNKMFDNAEPSNPDSNRKRYGNNNYPLSNIHQWLNSDKSANSWYEKSHTYDAPPDYTNQDGFLKGWTNEELQTVLNAEWTTTRHSIDGGGSETFRSKITLPSTTEMGLESNTGGARIDIFNNDGDRVVTGKYYWCRTPYPSNSHYVRPVNSSGTLSYAYAYYASYGVRPICSIPETTLVSDVPDSDGCYTFVFIPPLERTVAWDKKKEFYARQFTYNSKKQYQTMLEGATAYLPIMPDGQELSKLPSKSKVKLGKFNGTPLKWLVCRDSADQSLRLILDGESVGVIGNKMFDNSEPNSSNSAIRNNGDSRYIWSNIHQWLNSDKPANQWFTPTHAGDVAPGYANTDGFLKQWTKEELDVLENTTWIAQKSSHYGGGTESFQSKMVLPSRDELGGNSNTDGNKLDIFNSDSDRVVLAKAFTRSSSPESPGLVWGVNTDGKLNIGYTCYTPSPIFPICKPNPNVKVSLNPDSEGCYTLI